jgi:hypothetical protein
LAIGGCLDGGSGSGPDRRSFVCRATSTKTTGAAGIRVGGKRAADCDSEVADDNRLMMAIDKEMRWQPQTLISAAPS